MLKLTLLVTALVSFVNFCFPKSFALSKAAGEKVLGIKQTTQMLNIETVRTAVLAHCLATTRLPDKLNDLYQNELLKERFLDLDSNFTLIKGQNFCQFDLTPKN